MACYDCEDCSYNTQYGGPCKEFEYDCPYVKWDRMKKDNVSTKALKDILSTITDAVQGLKVFNSDDLSEIADDLIRCINTKLDLDELDDYNILLTALNRDTLF